MDLGLRSISGVSVDEPHEPDFVDHFDAPRLDPDRWIDGYLPQWTTPDRAAARYHVDDAGLVLRIEVHSAGSGFEEQW